MKFNLSTFIKALISFGLMGFLLYYFLSQPDDRQALLAALSNVNYAYLALALALFILAIISNAVKWQILLRAQGVPVPLTPITNLTFVGAFFNNFLPANVGGDVVRGIFLARYIERNADAAVSVVVDKVIGLLAFMFTAVVAAFVAVWLVTQDQRGLADNEAIVQNLTQIEVAAVLGTLIIAGGFAIMLSQRLRAFGGRVFDIKLLAPLAPIYHQLSNAFGAYRYQYKALLLAFVVGLLNPILTGLVDIAIVAAMGENINPVYIFLLNPIIAVALILPVSIGGLGTGSGLYIFFYGLVGVTQPIAFALSLFKQLIIYLGSLPGGLLWLRNQDKAAAARNTTPTTPQGGPESV